ncbi:hypothetical protein OL548_10450 [Lysinibacillus sp. MHQ-1]|nr:hypothetical protein OL548_10450 [Lysinibacillus sp. MHQ-1]
MLKNIRTMAVTCNGDTPMAKLTDELIALNHISEKKRGHDTIIF